jgi:hypothetical protein
MGRNCERDRMGRSKCRAASASGAARRYLAEHGEVHLAFLVGDGINQAIQYRTADRQRH